MSKIQTKKTRNRIKREQRLSIIVFFQICMKIFTFHFNNIKIKSFVIFFFQIVGYFISWTPYSLVAMYSAFINSHHISPMAATLPAMFAKSSLAWSTVLFIHSNKEINSKLNFSLFKTHLKNEIVDLPERSKYKLFIFFVV